jgi:anti-sigma factor RsiW
MTCISDGILRARMDGELTELEMKEVDAHLGACPACRKRTETIAAQAEEVRQALTTLTPLPGEAPTDARLALARFRAEHAEARAQAVSWLARLFRKPLRPAWASLGVMALAVACFSFTPARSWAQRILAMLRVEKIAVVPVDLQFLQGPRDAGSTEKMVGQFISDSIVVTMHPGQPQAVADGAQASQLAGFRVRLLAGRPDPPKIKVQGEQAFQMTLNRDRLQSILDGLGRSDLQLPASIDGALLAVHIPKVVLAVYGNCPEHSSRESRTSPQMADWTGCVALAQVPSPTVSVPPELNIQQLAELGLQAAGLSAQDAQTFCQTVDWTSTLVLPIPRDAGSYESVSVDGVQGTLIAEQAWGKRPPGYVLLWVKDGIIYSLSGFGSPDQAVPWADSLE